MNIFKLAPLAAVLMLISVAGNPANAAPAHRGHFIQGANGNAANSDYRDPTTREAIDEGMW